jgi:hypothetical protein
MNETANGKPTSGARSDDETKGLIRLDGDPWFLRVDIAGRQRSFHLGHRRDFVSKDEVHAEADTQAETIKMGISGCAILLRLASSLPCPELTGNPLQHRRAAGREARIRTGISGMDPRPTIRRA